MAYAHSANDSGRRHDLVDHLRTVASLTAEFAKPLHAEQLGHLVGLWHDLGKFDPEFQKYLLACEREPTLYHKSPGHSTAGAWLALQHAWPLALAIRGHHGGLQAPEDLNTLAADESSERRAQQVLLRARAAVAALEPSRQPALPTWASRDQGAAEVLLRLLFSALIDADYLDTERHFRPEDAALRSREVSIAHLWMRLRDYHAGRFGSPERDAVSRLRREVYEACVAAAEQPPGTFRLTVPTGGGKTLSAMAFALRHAQLHGQRRVIVGLPFVSITEQTADVYRDVFGSGDEAVPVVLEHHSGTDRASEAGEDHRAHSVWARLAAENWDAPIIVTTTVQLFDSLFANTPGRCRKLHRLAGSVILLDEAQALPSHLLRPILDALRQLVAHFGTTVVISTATQPAFESIAEFADVPATEIVPNPDALFAELKRVDYEWHTEPLGWDDVAAVMRREKQALAVVNTKRDAMALLDALGGDGALHLSTLLCGAHRRRVIAEIGRRLSGGATCHVVSTQVIEAGVDLDFPVVLRALGPLDSVIQAAGRCNREGRLERGRVVVFQPAEGGVPPGPYRTATGITASLLQGARVNPDDPATAREYFRRFFGSVDADSKDIQDKRRRFHYPEVARRFRMIDDETVGAAITQYGSPDERQYVRRLIGQLRQGHPEGRLLRRCLQAYVVSVRASQAARYEHKGLLAPIQPGFYEWLGDYDEARGIVERGLEPDSLVV